MKILSPLRPVGLAFLCGLVSCAAALRAQSSPAVYQDKSQPLEARVEDLLSKMTVEEKVALLHGDSKFTTAAIERLGLSRRWLSDGPHGVREDIGPDSWNPAGHTDDFATAMPCGIALAATWNPALARTEGAAIGQEALARGKNIMLGPAVNIMRTPLNGRNFEYFGEDPFLTSRIAVAYIQGVQAEDVASCIKHFAANNQETQRGSVNVEMDERTLREIYLPAFEAAVKEANVWSVMAAYNRFRGDYCAQNDYLLNQVLKKEWGFKGLVMTDWGGAHDSTESIFGGLDLEMGTDRPYNEFYLAQPYLDGLQAGFYSADLLDDKARRNLRVMIATKVLDGRPAGSLNTAAHQTVARQVAEEGAVLLKNTNAALPLDAAQITSVAVIGDNATKLLTHGGQSSEIKAFYEITPLQGLINRIGARATITFAQGYTSTVAGARGRRGAPATAPVSSATLIDQAVAAAKQADVAIVFAGLNHDQDSEGRDKRDLSLPYNQDELIQRVVAANPRTIVVLVAGSPVAPGPWLAQVPAVLLSWYSGMEGGNAIARLLFGDVNPSGKLPCTFPAQLADSPAHSLGPLAYPGQGGVERYDEGLLVGYRWFDTKNIAPLFAFGHGLSYTTFEYSNLKLVPGTDSAVAQLSVQFDLTNTGPRAGAEVAQVYIKDVQSALPRPDKELKGFQKVSLQPGETKSVTIALDQPAFAYYDPDKKGWLAEAGDFKIIVGGSSRDPRLAGDFKLTQAVFRK